MARTMTGAEMVLKALADQGVTHIFGYPGGAVLPIYDEMFQQEKVQHILVRHEQGAVHAAEGYARSTGKVGVVLVTSGPGATNAVTGLTDALLDSIPIVCLTGQVPTHLIGNDAFQECDTVGITRPCTKHNWLVKRIEDLPRVLHEAFHVAKTGRPGPVVVDIPKDIQFAKGEYVGPEQMDFSKKAYKPRVKGDSTAIEKAVELLANAKKPLFYTGGGVINSGPNAAKLLREFVSMTGYPITSTLMGLGAFPAADPLWLGMLGMHGTYEANLAMHDCDVMLCVGARFDDRITGRIDAFAPNSKKIHIDIDPSSINKNVRVDVPIIGDIGNVLADMLSVWRKKAPPIDKKALKAWWKQIDTWKAKDCLKYKANKNVIMPQLAIERLYALTKDRDTYITTEVGQHQMWAAQFYRFEEPNRWMTSGGLGTMGYGLPAAVGVQVAHPGCPRHRHRGRCQRADDHAGNVDGRAAQPADQDLHPEQPVHGHGAPVAAAAARQPVVEQLHGQPARLREAGRSLRLRRLPRRAPRRARRQDRRDDRGEKARAVRLPGGEFGELFPDDPERQGPQRDAAGRRRAGRGDRQGHRERRQDAGLGGPYCATPNCVSISA